MRRYPLCTYALVQLRDERSLGIYRPALFFVRFAFVASGSFVCHPEMQMGDFDQDSPRTSLEIETKFRYNLIEIVRAFNGRGENSR